MRICYLFKIYFLLLFILTIFSQDAHSQSYGLGFYSHEVIQDKRTSLDLSSKKDFCFDADFDIAFDMSFLVNHDADFGYIIRIIENDKRNFDLVLDNDKANAFNLIIDGRPSKISFKLNRHDLYSNWNNFHIKFDVDNDRIILYAGNRAYADKGLGLRKNGCYKILFGANFYRQFGTTDLPPMKIKDIKISEHNSLKYHWPLSEQSGVVSHEVVVQNDAVVTNPLWIKAEHYYWQPVQRFFVKGPAGVAFNKDKELLYITGNDSLFSYSVKKARLSSTGYLSGKQDFNVGNQAVFNNTDSLLYSFYLDQKFITVYNFNTQKWDKKYKHDYMTNFLHHNKFISYADSCLYVLGGYGHHLYRNKVRQYSFKTHTWQTLNDIKGDHFVPRYLAALSTTELGDTAYILGGYGSTSGQQILNPRNLYDMMRFTAKDHTFKKLFELNMKGEDFAFANSLIIDEKAKTYYGLIFPMLKYESHLQLIKGSLLNNSYTEVGNTIPFSFNDLFSFADIYYCKASQKFVAITLVRDAHDVGTEVNIYTLSGPPEPPTNTVTTIITTNNNWRWFIIALTLIIATVAGWLTLRRRKIKSAAAKQKPVIVHTNSENEETLTDTAPVTENTPRASIYLFGELQLITENGNEIVNSFTSLTKELFIFIFLHSVKWGRGVSAEKLNEILWFDKDEKSARNNRSVNIAKLKHVLDQMGHCNISRDTGYWKIDADYKYINVDYHNYLNIISDKSKLTKQKIIELAEISQRGSFLSNCEYEWLDQQKSEISNEIIDTYLKFAHAIEIRDDAEFLIKISNHVFYLDPVNEEAMELKCKALVFLGKHSLAKSTFENFKKEYKNIYAEDFKKDFHSILG